MLFKMYDGMEIRDKILNIGVPCTSEDLGVIAIDIVYQLLLNYWVQHLVYIVL